MSVQDRLREIVRDAIKDSGTTQRAIAAELGVSEQHISRMLVGTYGLSLDWAEKITSICGRQISVDVTTSAAGDS